MTMYLIDFENVHEDGFAGIGKLALQDCVYCFFTRNAPKISLSVLAESKGIQFRFIEASAGKQSLDMALGSYLGYLIARSEAGSRYVIISNDAGFAKVAEFWNRRLAPGTVRVCKNILDALGIAEKKPEKKTETRVEVRAENKSVSRSERGRGQRRQSVQKKAEAVPAEVTAQEPVSVPAEEPKPQETDAAAAAPQTPAQEEKPAVPEAPAETLSGEEFDGASLEFVQSQIAKFAGEKNIKQLVYRAIVKKFGQKKGTRLYNSIKKTIA